ncbi:Holliday junction branch migration protein RuvA [Patescibacteria group bacterium]|nr:Holliday junction branch migration protein RuvA [Patescibacteria group bacterium]MBU4458790.1 Holliday junction branch migration protein RuvA [Patescibacteria group bacterium]MCG2696406.1 Holliday junction branch migration protein RuvA [Candidatus Portnoybacteria bacterium]
MIGSIEGKIEYSTDKYALIDVNGIGYKVYISVNTFKNLPEKSSKIKLFTHLHVREDIMDLYGFLNQEDLEFFELLISISGIGPKGALNILNVASVENLKKAIANEESSILTKVSGIGKKIAEKIILELKNKVGGEFIDEKFGTDGEAIDALVSLGYRLQEAREALKKVPEAIKEVGDKVRHALKILGKSR